MNYSTAKQQLHQIVMTEIAKYYQKSISPAGLSLEDLRCLEIIAKMSQFEQDIRTNDETTTPKTKEEIDSLLNLVKSSKPESPDE